jgi:hypothetical protein
MKVEMNRGAKVVLLLVLAVLIGLIALQEGPAARRYLKIETM